MNPQSKLMGRKPPNSAAHGGGVRGATLPRRSSQFEGAFGRMFRTLPPADFSAEALRLLAGTGKLARPGAPHRPDGITSPPEVDATDATLPAAPSETDKGHDKNRIHDAEENSGIDAGYTYFGQFIDHDITFDPASSLQKQNDPDGLVDFRTPRLDLDCLYGRGPDDQPYMYTGDGKRFLLGDKLFEGTTPSPAKDLPRHVWTEKVKDRHGNSVDKHFARALIGDKRNDENSIVSQLHSAMMQFHNRLIEDGVAHTFGEAQRLTRWHYQYAVVHDFLPTIVCDKVYKSVLPHVAKGVSIFDAPPALRFYQPEQDAYIPIEFAAAAYRFGHSMVRPIYRLNTQNNDWDRINHLKPQNEEERGLAGRFFIFAGVHNRGLNGFDAYPKDRAIDWSLFFAMNGSGDKNVGGTRRAQPAYKIDPSMVNPLAFLPEFSDESSHKSLTVAAMQGHPHHDADGKPQMQNLALRNLMRGLFMSLPSGQDVARAMGETPLRADEMFVGKATYADAVASADGISKKPKNPLLASLHPDFEHKAPLWYYVLAESLANWRKEVMDKKLAEQDADETAVRLGAVGGRIVAETLVGLLLNDSQSYLSQDPNWKPIVATETGSLRMADMIGFALRLDGSLPPT